jgi:ABC-type Fe3+-hydroxamate transport system substrate-binding protein
MRTLLVISLLLVASVALAQALPQQTIPTVADLQQQMEQIGCKAETQAAAQTIVNLQKQNAELQKQLAAAKDPPKSGATKH